MKDIYNSVFGDLRMLLMCKDGCECDRGFMCYDYVICVKVLKTDDKTKEEPVVVEYVPIAEQSYVGVSALFTALNATYDPANEVTKWIKENPDALTLMDATTISKLFTSVKDEVNQISIAMQLGALYTNITCDIIAAAAKSSLVLVRSEVVAALLKTAVVSDKANKAVVQKEISKYAFMCVEDHFEDKEV